MDKQNKNKDYISSISRASKILDAVFESEAPVGVSPLSKAVGLSKGNYIQDSFYIGRLRLIDQR